MADADLKQLADDLKDTIARDAAEFNTRNIGSAQLATYDTLIAAFDNTTTDVELQGAISAAVEIKNATVSAIHKAVRIIRDMAEQAYDGKGRYRTFGFEDMTRLSDNDLYRMTKRVVRVATSVQADLAGRGLIATQLTNLTALGTQLDNDIDAVHDAEEQRDLQTQDRIKKGNLLYKEMVRLSSIGRSLFQDTDEAKYNDYVLIGSRVKGDDKDGGGTAGGIISCPSFFILLETDYTNDNTKV